MHKEAKNSVDDIDNSKHVREEKDNSIKIQHSFKYAIPTSIELIPIPMKNDRHFQDQDHFTSNVNKQLPKSKEPAYDHQINVVETTGKKHALKK